MLGSRSRWLTGVFLNVLVGLMLRGDVETLQGLAQDGWQYWPDDRYVTHVLQSQLTPQMTQFLFSVALFTVS